ncbi:hydrolase [Paenibacillus sp. N1-5-1-14]|uniref:hydrolase n=1 Tax=Paenibacillus radicibacter TaxID=2972488 RepID=UPI0021593BED|nr:hydrolase [Paenibacillus radicibacter]MCR8644447.1 hydrolase [Paenibacillus radicibacter]
MGSRMMHLIIVNQIADRLSMHEKGAFLLGGVAPDAVSTKEESHFFAGSHVDYTRYVDYEGFLSKYSSYKHTKYILGYYTHLIADDLWLKGFYMPWLKNRLEQDSDLLKRYHHDFTLLNGKLLNYYSFPKELMLSIAAEIEKVRTVEIQEVREQDLISFMPELWEDMTFKEQSLAEPLRVFTLDQIVGYIETSVDRGTMYLRKLFDQEVSV